MRQALSALLCSAALLCAEAASAQGSEAALKRAAESILKIEADNQAASGFIWQDGQHAVTALHVVDGKQRITAHYVGPDGRIQASTPATVERVLKEADLVLLRLQNPQPRKPLALSLAAPAVRQPLDALGFPLNIAGYSNTELRLRFGGSQLRSILPPKLLAQFTDYPSTTSEILNLEGNLVPGLSGAPLLDAQGLLVGIANGGLEDGAVGICWGIPAAQLQRLALSTVTRTPGAPRVAALFSADLQASVAPTQRVGEFGLTKLRSRSYAQLAGSADDQLGLAQLSQLFQMFNPNQFRYDIYQEQRTGATVVLPEGARLSAQGDWISVDAGDARMTMRLQLKALRQPAEAQELASGFELALTQPGPGVVLMGDPQWSYLQPMSRYGVTVHRKAIYRSLLVNGMPMPQQYFFETLATNGSSLLAVAAVNMDSSMPTANFEMACAQGLRDGRCPLLMRQRALWAQMVLGVQFSSFPQAQF